MNDNFDFMHELKMQNPDLPILPIVDSDIFGGDGGPYEGSWGRAFVDEYLKLPNYQIVFKSDDEVFDVLESYLPYDEWNKLPDWEEECKPYYDALPWTRAIIVFINPPDYRESARKDDVVHVR